MPSLRLVDDRPAWKRLKDETSQEYGLFVLWIFLDECPPVPVSVQEIAERNHWTERANVLQSDLARPKRPGEMLGKMRILALETAYMGFEKLWNQEAEAKTLTLKPSELLALAGWSGEAESVLRQLQIDQRLELDLSQYTIDEKRILLDAQRLLKRTTKAA